MTHRRALGAGLALLLTACAPTSPGPASSSVAQTPEVVETPTPPPSLEPTPAAAAWRQLAIEGAAPAAREDHTWTLTPDGATGYLFGGRDGGTVFDDLWAFDLTTDTWQRVVAAAGPAGRFGHNAAWAPGIGLVIFAGQAGSAFYADLWAYDPAANAWRELPAGGAVPVPRYGSCAAIGPDGRLWISHGFTSEGQRFADTLAYDFTTATWTDETPAGDRPVSRCLHACWWTDDGRFNLYAGQTTGVLALGDRWVLTQGARPGTNSWLMLSQEDNPTGLRNLPAAARWDAATLVFGGEAEGGFLQDAWLLFDSGTSFRVPVVGSLPPSRSASELIADPTHQRLLLFGGKDGERVYDDLWELTLP